MPDVSIIIPAFNEAQRIGKSLRQILAHAASDGWDYEIIVVNDGSTDHTAEIVKTFAAKHARVRLIQNPGNRGKGFSVRNGVMNACGDLLLFSDADLSSPIEEASKLLNPIRQGVADISIGSRYIETRLQTRRQPLYRRILGRGFNLALRAILGLAFKDSQCGFKAFTRESAFAVFSQMRIERWGFDPEILFLAKLHDFRVLEIPVQWAHDSRSKINPIVDGLKMVGDLLEVRWNHASGRYTGTKARTAIMTGQA